METNPSVVRPFLSYADALSKSMKRFRQPLSFPNGRIASGLQNLGNTCFLNAILQCITHTIPVVEKLRCVADHACDTASFCLLCALREHIHNSMSSSGSSVAPASLANNMSKLSPYLRLGQQEDAHEFFNILLDRLDTCCLSIDTNSSDSLVTQVFGGCLRSRLECDVCGHISDTFEPMLDISLEIEDAFCLDDALQSFTRVEIIDALVCGGCNVPVPMNKQLKVDRAPTVIAVHLKRFRCDGFSTTKIDKFLEYPLELDLDPYLTSRGNTGESMYELYALVVHRGSANQGHYYSFVRPSSLEWYLMDDSRVTKASKNCILTQNAYILFYIKKTSPSHLESSMDLKTPCVAIIKDLEASDSSKCSSEQTPDEYPSYKKPRVTQ